MKTYGTAMEFAYHITGLYPKDWKGEVVEDPPSTGYNFLCIGKTLDSVCKVLQKELLGVENANDADNIGKGSIPLSCIELDKGLVKDGAIIRTIKIKHKSGKYNKLMFYSSINAEKTIQGISCRFGWIDEIPDSNPDELYSQFLMRTADVNGSIIFTATPETGSSTIYNRFVDNKDGLLYLQHAGWDDVASSKVKDGHLTDQIIKGLEAGLAPHQIEMRRKGLPILGAGVVFHQTDESIIAYDVFIKDHWLMTGAVDFGKTQDPSIVMINAYDPDNDVSYLVHEIILDKNRSPKAIADAVKSCPWPNVKIVVPHDGFNKNEAQDTIAKQLEFYGLNVHTLPVTNPSTCRLGLDVLSLSKSGHQAEKEPGIAAMRFAFDTGKLKVAKECETWFKEKRSYYYKVKEGKQELNDFNDHCMDCSRYAYVLGFLNNIYNTVEQAKQLYINQFQSFNGHSF